MQEQFELLDSFRCC